MASTLPEPPLSGLLNINKPAGWTSFDVVGFIRGRSRIKRVGHAGRSIRLLRASCLYFSARQRVLPSTS